MASVQGDRKGGFHVALLRGVESQEHRADLTPLGVVI